MKKLMIIGAGKGQVPLILKAKEHGLFVLVVSPVGDYPGIDLADLHVNEDIYDKERLLEIALAEKIDFVLSDQSDFAVPTVAFIAEKLNLPGNSIESAEYYTNKNKMRSLCSQHGIPIPAFVTINKIEQIENISFPLPWIVKPSDSQGSRGVKKINYKEELKDGLSEALKYSKQHCAIVEEFFEGREVVCEGFVLNGQYYNVAFGDRKYFDLKDLFIPSQTIFPSTLDIQYIDKIIQFETKIAQAAQPKFGIIHSEYLINETTGEIRIVETALRGGGVYIASDLIPLSTGIDLTELLLLSMLGYMEDVEKKLLNSNRNKVAAYICFYLKEGGVTFASDFNELKKNSSVIRAEIENIKEGYNVPLFVHKGMRQGPFIVNVDSLGQYEELLSYLEKEVLVEVDGCPGVVWS